LSSEINRERVSSIIREVDFSDLNSVIGQEVVPDKLKVFACSKESEDLSVVVQELFLRGNSSSSKFLFEEFE
jgi:hypothetical protein